MNKLIKALSCLVLITGWAACTQPNWDEHYSSHVDDILDVNLFQAMQEHSSELNIFLTMLHQTGYDSLLMQSQSYTVWAPSDAYLKDIDLKNEVEVQQIVKNHISRFPYPTNQTQTGTCSVKMLDKKRINFWGAGGSFFFGSQPLAEKDITVNNGILHILDGCEPYIRNMMEYMHYTPGYDSIYNFIKSYDVDLFMQSLSTVIGVKDGQTIYDSVFYHYNALLNTIGDIDSEDEVHTMILPDNNAWVTMYDSISHYFVQSPHNHGVTIQECDSVQKAMTNVYLIYNLVFKDDHTPLDILNAESMVTTTKTVIKDPKAFFADEDTETGLMEDTVVSNGRLYLADELHLSRDSWCPEECYEVEQNYNLASDAEEEPTRNIYIRDASGTVYEDSISGHKYIEVKPRSLSVQPQVTFSLSGLRSTKYDIYVVFVPQLIDYELGDTIPSLKPSKVGFTLMYIDESGDFTSNYYYELEAREINPYKMDTVKVNEGYWEGDIPAEFPYNDAYDDDGLGTRLQIYNAVEATELDDYNRSMLIDCIIVKPVE